MLLGEFVLERGKGTFVGEGTRLRVGIDVGGLAGRWASEMYGLGGMARGRGCGFCLGACSAVSCVSGMTEWGPWGGGGGASVICMTKPFVLPKGGNMSNSGKPALGFVVYLALRLDDEIVGSFCVTVSEGIKGELDEYYLGSDWTARSWTLVKNTARRRCKYIRDCQ